MIITIFILYWNCGSSTDYASDKLLVEDKDFVLDKKIDNYAAVNTENEYYRVNNRYFDTKEIAEKLSSELEETGEAVLRTDYDLDDERFYEITDEIYEIMGDEIDLYGYYWMGVIYLRLGEPSE